MPKTRLGIDIGTASLGWCFYSLRDDKDKGGKPVTEIDGVIDAGVRIFSDSRSREQGKQYLPLNVFRRESRLASRGRDRYLQRRDALMRYLVRYGLMPEDRTARKRLEELNPYELRAWAISDNESPHPQFESQHLVGRAIFHLNQRRGFKSNRRTDKTQSGDESEKKKTDKEAGAMKSAVEKFDQEIKAAGCKTAGEFLWKKHGGRSVRARPKGSQNRIEFYEGYYATRALIEAEFDAIWKKQAEIHPQIFTDERGRVLREIIFHQRPLAPAVVGRCTFCPEYRARKGLPSYQRFRILQEVNNLRLRGGGKIPKEAREEISDRLLKWRELQDDDGLLHFDEMKKIVEAHGVAVTSVFTVASRRRAGLFGDKTSHILREIVGEQWDKWTAKTQDDLVHLILDPSTEDEKTTATIIKDYGLDSEQAKKCVNADMRLNSEHGEVCLRDIGELLPHLEKGLIYNEAVKAAGLGSHSDQRTEFDGSMPKLPPYQKVLPQYCNPLRKRDEGDKKAYRISNPTVHVGLNQLRLVVNDIIRIHGKPTEIVVELAREFGMGKIGKEDYGFLQSRLQAENTRRRKEIEDLGFSANEGNLLKMRLWEELNSNPCHRCCVYTGKRISITNLFSPDVEIEHILPFSKTGDNSTANKTLCYRQENRIKSDRTPFEEFGENSNYEEIVNRAKQFVSDPALEAIYYRRERRKVIQAGRDIKKIPPYKNRKYKRFEANAKEKFLGEHDDFTERYLNETQFLSRAAKQYLEAICPRNNILVIHGGLTALIRRGMGLDSILSDDEATQKKRAEINDALACEIISEEEAKRRKGDLYRGKNRNDHRHHAVDAAVIGATSRSLLQELSTEAKKMEDINSKRFAKTVKEAIKKRGIDLRDEIAAKIDGVIISHKPQRGRDGQLHKKFAYRILHDEDKGEGVYTREVVRSGKTSKINAVPIKDRKGKYYKAYESGSNWACEIYQTKDGNWSGEVITTFDANRKKTTTAKDGGKVEYCNFIPEWRRHNPTAKLVMRIYSGDLLALEKKGKKRIVRVQRMDTTRIWFADHLEANTANRDDAKAKLGISKWDNSKCEKFRVLLKENSSATVRDILTPRDGEWKFNRMQAKISLSAWAKMKSAQQETPIQTDKDKKEFVGEFLGKMLILERTNPGGLKKAKARKLHVSPAGLVFDPGFLHGKKPNDRAHS